MKLTAMILVAASLASCAGGITGTVAGATVGASATVAQDDVIVGAKITANKH